MHVPSQLGQDLLLVVGVGVELETESLILPTREAAPRH